MDNRAVEARRRSGLMRWGVGVATVAAMAACGHAGPGPRSKSVQQGRLEGRARAPFQGSGRVLTGTAAYAGWQEERPGIFRKITPADMPPPYSTRSVDAHPDVVPRPPGVFPQAPPGFQVNLFASDLVNPRKIVTAPNGDIFVAESKPGRIVVLRDSRGAGRASVRSVFASGLSLPFGIAFYPPGRNPSYVYVANTGSVVRFPYRPGDLRSRNRAEMVAADIPSGGHLEGGGHWTRDLAFSPDGSRLFVSVGSRSNDWEHGATNEYHRADILEYSPGGGFRGVFASGIRNAVGIAVDPVTGDLWGSVNERDGMGDNLPPDYITRIRQGGFLGWPWYYIGSHPDPRHRGERPELRGRVLVPDVLVQPHMASLCMTFYTGDGFPAGYRNDVFAAEHGSWNRLPRTGYEVVRVPVHNGVPEGVFEDFLTGFVTPAGRVWGRPVGVTTASDGSLLVSDDGSDSIWRVKWVGQSR